MTPSSSIEDKSFNYINDYLINKFYKFMSDIYIEHQQLKIKQQESIKNEQIFIPLQEFSSIFSVINYIIIMV